MKAPRFPRQFDLADSSTEEGGSTECLDRRNISESSSAEVILSCDAESPSGVVSRTQRPLRARGVFVPENYEPTYAYPLVVWLHSAGRSEREIVDVLPLISTRNYLGLALRGTAAIGTDASPSFGWCRSSGARQKLQDELYASVRNLRHDFHLHTERIFLVGDGDGATEAWDLFLSHPEWFAGLAVLGGRFPWGRRALRRYHELRGRRVLVAADSQSLTDRCQRDELKRLLYSAGLEVSVVCRGPNRQRAGALLRQIDSWIMESIGGCL